MICCRFAKSPDVLLEYTERCIFHQDGIKFFYINYGCFMTKVIFWELTNDFHLVCFVMILPKLTSWDDSMLKAVFFIWMIFSFIRKLRLFNIRDRKGLQMTFSELTNNCCLVCYVITLSKFTWWAENMLKAVFFIWMILNFPTIDLEKQNISSKIFYINYSCLIFGTKVVFWWLFLSS